MSVPSPRTAVATALALALPLLAPAVAGAAGQVSFDGAVVHVSEALAGERNSVTVALQQPGLLEVSDYGEIAIGAGCERSELDPATALCPLPPGGVEVSTGAGDDVVGSYYAGILALPDGALRVSLGDGNDIFHGNVPAEIVDGGAGNDQLDGEAGDDTLDGGAGDDVLLGKQGRDTLRGGDGIDNLTGDASSELGVFADLLDGGPGVDTLKDYMGQGGESAAPPIAVTFDGLANDGRAGEGDNVIGIERVEPSSSGSFVGDDGPNEWTAPAAAPGGSYAGRGGADVLRGSDRNGDVLDGGAGDDDLAGGLGDDTLVGGPGRDALAGDRPLRCNELHCDFAGGGNDVIDARDGEVDSVTCGFGNDRVIADADDVVDADCETVERPVQPQPQPDRDGGRDGGRGGGRRATVALGGRAPRLAAALRRGLTARVGGVRAGARVGATLTLAAPTARKLKLTRGRVAVVVARGAAKADAGGRATVRLRFTAAARRRLARARSLKLTLRAGGAAARVGLKR